MTQIIFCEVGSGQQFYLEKGMGLKNAGGRSSKKYLCRCFQRTVVKNTTAITKQIIWKPKLKSMFLGIILHKGVVIIYAGGGHGLVQKHCP